MWAICSWKETSCISEVNKKRNNNLYLFSLIFLHQSISQLIKRCYEKYSHHALRCHEICDVLSHQRPTSRRALSFLQALTTWRFETITTVPPYLKTATCITTTF